MAGKKKRELTEEAALETALRDHPDWRRAWDQGELPEEIVGEDGEPMIPRAHLHIHAVRHEIGAVVAEHMWYMTKEGSPFDEGRFLE